MARSTTLPRPSAAISSAAVGQTTRASSASKASRCDRMCLARFPSRSRRFANIRSSIAEVTLRFFFSMPSNCCSASSTALYRPRSGNSRITPRTASPSFLAPTRSNAVAMRPASSAVSPSKKYWNPPFPRIPCAYTTSATARWSSGSLSRNARRAAALRTRHPASIAEAIAIARSESSASSSSRAIRDSAPRRRSVSVFMRPGSPRSTQLPCNARWRVPCAGRVSITHDSRSTCRPPPELGRRAFERKGSARCGCQPALTGTWLRSWARSRSSVSTVSSTRAGAASATWLSP